MSFTSAAVGSPAFFGHLHHLLCPCAFTAPLLQLYTQPCLQHRRFNSCCTLQVTCSTSCVFSYPETTCNSKIRAKSCCTLRLWYSALFHYTSGANSPKQSWLSSPNCFSNQCSCHASSLLQPAVIISLCRRKRESCQVNVAFAPCKRHLDWINAV